MLTSKEKKENLAVILPFQIGSTRLIAFVITNLFCEYGSILTVQTVALFPLPQKLSKI